MRAELEKPHAMRTVAGAGFRAGWMAAALSLLLPTLALASGDEPVAVEREYASTPPAPVTQTWAEADAKSAGCVGALLVKGMAINFVARLAVDALGHNASDKMIENTP